MKDTMKNFALLGAAGYIAPRHMQAIAETGNNLAIACDTSDSVGIIDRYFPQADFYKEFELLNDALHSRRTQKNSSVDYVSIATPNYLHKAHICAALRAGCDVICEKPLVLTPESLDVLNACEKETGQRISTVLQLRLHDSILGLRDKILNENKPEKYDVDLTYITSRGAWYAASWKGDAEKSGGLATNIGVHFYDMLYFLFGDVQEVILHYADDLTVAGYLEYENARVRWFLSTDAANLPEDIAAQGQTTYRSITINGAEVEFSGGFTDLHTRCYESVLAGSGYGVEDNRTAIETVASLRHMQADMKRGDAHPFLSRLKKKVV